MAAEPRLRQEGFHTHPQRLQIILHASRSSPGPAAALKAVGGLARGVNVLLDTNVLSESMRERPAFARRQIDGGFEGPAHSGAGIL